MLFFVDSVQSGTFGLDLHTFTQGRTNLQIDNYAKAR